MTIDCIGSRPNPLDRGYYNEHDLKEFGIADVGKNVRVGRSVTMVGLGNVSIGNNVRIDDFSIIVASRGFLDIHDNVHIGGNSQLTCAGGLTIKNWSGCSSGCRIFTESDDYTGRWLNAGLTVPAPLNASKYALASTGPIVFEKYVVLGTNSVVLPNCVLGEGAAVGALSLVTKSLEPWGVYFGSPAKRIKNRLRNCVALDQQYLTDLNAL